MLHCHSCFFVYQGRRSRYQLPSRAISKKHTPQPDIRVSECRTMLEPPRSPGAAQRPCRDGVRTERSAPPVREARCARSVGVLRSVRSAPPVRVGRGAAHPRQRGRRGRRAQGAIGVRRRASAFRQRSAAHLRRDPSATSPTTEPGAEPRPGSSAALPAELGKDPCQSLSKCSDLLNICTLSRFFVRRNFTFCVRCGGEKEGKGSQRASQKDTSLSPPRKAVGSVENRGEPRFTTLSTAFLTSLIPLSFWLALF